MTYPHSPIVVMGLCPNGPGRVPLFGDGPSVSANRMDSLVPNWRDRALGVNAWATKRDWQEGLPSNVHRILEATSCTTVIALGAEVQQELGLGRHPGAFYRWQTIFWLGREIRVLRFPHPSGINRHWNEPINCRRATDAFREALRLPVVRSHEQPTRGHR